ncbi:Pal1-domain-containing protein [Nadsonia fulvescens var. elongata DSM 6958]|uniref:Pal1-domain-containing protein n=1 Tax=Nadsonia fulvescens var. elongata DSM 6958 TaxID=857566 RepID=A0A1E3PLB2_9ASCO|nr:Pal1-domain-containing protein [Nadsonia fulvescens var. elongata DSM 6958]
MTSTNPFSSNNPFRRSVISPVETSDNFSYRRSNLSSDDLFEDSHHQFLEDRFFNHSNNSDSVYLTGQFSSSHDSILASRPSSAQSALGAKYGNSQRSFENRQYSSSSQTSSAMNRRSTNPFLDEDFSFSNNDLVSQKNPSRPGADRNYSSGEKALPSPLSSGTFSRPILNSHRSLSPWAKPVKSSDMSRSVSPKKSAPPPPPPPANRTSLYVSNSSNDNKVHRPPFARPVRANSVPSLLESPQDPLLNSSAFRDTPMASQKNSQHTRQARQPIDESGNSSRRSNRSHVNSHEGFKSTQDKPRSSSTSNYLSSSKPHSSSIPVTSSDSDRKSKSRSSKSKSKSKSSSKTKKNGEPLDKIDMLDVTGFYGGGSFHHDGPFDACRPHRNKTGTRPAPVAAFPINGPNNALSGWANGQADGENTVDAIFGRGDQEAYLDFNSSYNKGFPSQKAKNLNPYNNPSASASDSLTKNMANQNINASDNSIINFNSTSKATPVHGSTTLGLGSSTFVEGAPAPKNYESSNPVDINSANSGLNNNFTTNKGLSRKKSLVQRLRGNRDPSPSNPSKSNSPAYRSASNVSAHSTDTMIINRQSNSSTTPASRSLLQSSSGNVGLNSESDGAQLLSSPKLPTVSYEPIEEASNSLSWANEEAGENEKLKTSTGSRLLGRVKSLRVSRKNSQP